MTDNNAQAARARGQAMRSARLARARMIRRRIVAGAVALFVASWLLITIVLVSGNDPALAKRSSASTVASSSTPATTTTLGTTRAGPPARLDLEPTVELECNSGSGTVSSVTTSQS